MACLGKMRERQLALNSDQRKQVSDAISDGLDRAVDAWSRVGEKFLEKAMATDQLVVEAYREPSKIPGHPWVSEGVPKVDEFIALVVDMRNSSQRLKTSVSSKTIEHGFQRIYYETSALLPAISIVCSFENGVVTEYLGDGALALFRVDEEDRDGSIRQASRAARCCVGEMRELINCELASRFSLPAIHLGAGLAMGRALVTLVGSRENLHPKAIGECVWEATKLSAGVNAVHVSGHMRAMWPASKNGKMKFHKKEDVRGVNGYRLKEG